MERSTCSLARLPGSNLEQKLGAASLKRKNRRKKTGPLRATTIEQFLTGFSLSASQAASCESTPLDDPLSVLVLVFEQGDIIVLGPVARTTT